MQQIEQILDLTTVFVTAVSFAFALTRGIPAYSAIFGEHKYEYKFEKSRLPLAARLVGIFFFLSFVYSLLISGDGTVALVYAALMTFFVGVGCIIFVTYIPKK